MSRVNTAVVGVGTIGELHARLYAENRSTKLSAVVDIDEERATSVAQQYGNPAVETDVIEAIEKHDIDAITIATPEAYHVEPTREALAHDCDVLLEKPIAESIEDAEAIGSFVDSSSADLMIGYVSRFNPEYAALKERLDTDGLGSILSISAARTVTREVYDDVADWTNPMYYLGVHDIDLMRWFVGSEVATVSAEASAGLGDVETPAVVTATLRFENGTVGSLQINWARSDQHPAHRTEEYRITGTQGYGELTLENNPLFCNQQGCEALDAVDLYGRRTDMYRLEVEHFLDCIREDSTPLVTWQDGLRSLQVANHILAAIEMDGEVSVMGT